ncbi:hypothetical protein NSK_006991 [Nannochloropsis salina CCMP1776]|jgi:ESCRT-II complex subunit VPS25|uniref:Vacuolar protein-sorting-associated protein 25 n=1 Tax=Nannochloropsis salina CCMP1776 TaxID=1027361 RepID=A0A4D9CRB2_9STRA|nr:hypothetical protein NSK_006991 [Nannochloropsis salina CCMP1776]|eukprot:TFJ81742.1 hypothetical protein NSK_006991 [Nannochloropsis salina CCMP1776]
MVASPVPPEEALPEYHGFPPFFTLQPVLETRKMQLKLWRELVLKWHQAKGVQILKLNEWPHFANPAINRTLPLDGRREVVQSLVTSGHAEWKDDSRTTALVLWRSPQEVAASILTFIRDNGMAGNVYTVYELRAGDEITVGADFHGTEPTIFRRALEILERQGKAALFKGSSEEGDGIKFVADA